MDFGAIPGAPTDARTIERNLKRKHTFSEEEDMNPMAGITNIADVFLVLMVGFLIAFITMSGIPLTDLTKIDKSKLTEIENPESLTQDMMAGSGLQEQENTTVWVDPDTGDTFLYVDEEE